MSTFSFISVLLLSLTAFCFKTRAQDSEGNYHRISRLPDKLFSSVQKKSATLQAQIDRATIKYLHKLRRREMKLRQKVARKDSTAANEIFGDPNALYKNLEGKLAETQTFYQSLYSGHIDSMRTMFGFLNSNQLLNDAGASRVTAVLGNYNDLQQKLNQTFAIREAINKRREHLLQRLTRFNLGKSLRKYQQDVYYYQQQLDVYKRTLEDPKKVEALVLRAVSQIPAFRKFFSQYSQLGSLFSLPGSGDMEPLSLQGMQTRQLLRAQLQQRLGTGSAAQQSITQSLTDARSNLDKMKERIGRLGNNGQDLDMPGFKPNDEKTKSFFKRLELGTNIHSAKSNFFFPTRSDIGLSLGYKLNSKSVTGIGVSYKVGWGKDIRHVSISHQGLGLRSFIDVKLIGSFWFTGGGEMNYLSGFKSFDVLRNLSPWQKSALLGATKKYKVKKVTGNMQVLYDFLYNKQKPVTQPVVFRMGYTL